VVEAANIDYGFHILINYNCNILRVGMLVLLLVDTYQKDQFDLRDNHGVDIKHYNEQ
jgi:hypothetical protein